MMNSAMAVYAVKLFCGSVLECRKEGVSNERCQRCGENDETLLRCHPCRHYCCSDCFWQRSVLSKGLFEDTSCPVCDEWLSVPVQEEDGEKNEGTENSLWDLPPEEVARVSQAKYGALCSSVQEVSTGERRKAKYGQ